ncbi:MAG TPA: chorismate-binding protein, partial [Agromyces sp.]
WQDAPVEASEDLVVFGPGPGDPRETREPRIFRLHELIAARLGQQRPMLAVCLSHQVLARLSGLAVAPLAAPQQGVQREVAIFGETATIGYYNTFTAYDAGLERTPRHGLAIASDPRTGAVHALRGSGVASVQGHLESVLSIDGLATLGRLVDGALGTAGVSGAAAPTRGAA